MLSKLNLLNFAISLSLLISFHETCIFSEENSSEVFLINEKYMTAQKNLLERNKSIKDPYIFNVLGLEFIGLPGVFSPKECCENGFFVERIPVHEGDSVLEIGAGTGFFPVFAILKGASSVIATDISQNAVDNIAENAKLHHMETQIEAIQSDIFNSLSESQKFDVIYWNIPFSPSPESNLNLIDLIVFDPQNQFLERYLAKGENFLKPHGKLYLGYSSTHGNISKMKEIAKKYHWNVNLVAQAGHEDIIIVELYEFTKE